MMCDHRGSTSEWKCSLCGQECDGRCLSASDVGIPSNGVAYPDPYCSLHGYPEEADRD